MARKTYRKGEDLFHNETKEKFIFAGWNKDKSALLLNKSTKFPIKLSRKELDESYTSYASLEREAKERRKYQGWK